MRRFGEGDRVRVDIPEISDPDHDRYHGREGVVKNVVSDAASAVTGDERDDAHYRVQFDDGEVMDFRWRDLRPPISEE
jgi:ribosomal protein L21E